MPLLTQTHLSIRYTVVAARGQEWCRGWAWWSRSWFGVDTARNVFLDIMISSLLLYMYAGSYLLASCFPSIGASPTSLRDVLPAKMALMWMG